MMMMIIIIEIGDLGRNGCLLEKEEVAECLVLVQNKRMDCGMLPELIITSTGFSQ